MWKDLPRFLFKKGAYVAAVSARNASVDKTPNSSRKTNNNKKKKKKKKKTHINFV